MDFLIDLMMELLPELFAQKLLNKFWVPTERIPWKGLRWLIRFLILLIGVLVGIALPLLVVVLIILLLKTLGFSK